MRTAHTLVQFLALVAMVAGSFLLFGVPWALLIGGFGVLVASVTAEATTPRPVGRTSRDEPIAVRGER